MKEKMNCMGIFWVAIKKKFTKIHNAFLLYKTCLWKRAWKCLTGQFHVTHLQHSWICKIVMLMQYIWKPSRSACYCQNYFIWRYFYENFCWPKLSFFLSCICWDNLCDSHYRKKTNKLIWYRINIDCAQGNQLWNLKVPG